MVERFEPTSTPLAKMPSRANPNTPNSRKPKTAGKLRTKRQKTQRILRNRVSKETQTSQAIRRSAKPSRKKARKLERKARYDEKRRTEGIGEVEMSDLVKERRGVKSNVQDDESRAREEGLEMDIDLKV